MEQDDNGHDEDDEEEFGKIETSILGAMLKMTRIRRRKERPNFRNVKTDGEKWLWWEERFMR